MRPEEAVFVLPLQRLTTPRHFLVALSVQCMTETRMPVFPHQGVTRALEDPRGQRRGEQNMLPACMPLQSPWQGVLLATPMGNQALSPQQTILVTP